ncbi:MAG: type II toxin-antitoxin system PemK/MazF family toxin [Bacteroidia bacterium]|nr:type II toxin-antitoxin system PemK/MazF family toxin [Bacteroidia bacterium]
MKRGDIYWADLNPVIGSEIAKIRPVIIVSNDINNEFADVVTILPITTSTQKVYPFEVVLEIGEGGINEKSKIKANQIRSIDKKRLTRKIGKISKEKIYNVELAILIHLGIKV